MKTFRKTYLVESVKYNGEVYTKNTVLSSGMNTSRTRPEKVIQALKTTGKKGVLVEVLSANLKGKTDLHNKPYQPTKWIYTN